MAVVVGEQVLGLAIKLPVLGAFWFGMQRSLQVLEIGDSDWEDVGRALPA